MAEGTSMIFSCRKVGLQQLSQYLKDNSTSLKKVFNITIISMQTGLRFANALTKKHKLILKPFNAQNEILTSLK